MQETWVQFLGWEDPLDEGMATHSNTLAWRMPWTGEPGKLQSMGATEFFLLGTGAFPSNLNPNLDSVPWGYKDNPSQSPPCL